jgi:hypothetical protein
LFRLSAKSDYGSDGTGRAPRQPTASVIATVGTHELVGPAILEESCLALRFRVVLLVKRRQRQAGLELDNIACHDVTSSTGDNISIGETDGMVADQYEQSGRKIIIKYRKGNLTCAVL